MTDHTPTVERTCPICHTSFQVPARAPGRPRKFCSPRCRARHAERRRLARNREVSSVAGTSRDSAATTEWHPCGWCGIHSPGAAYCSLACNALHDRLKHLRYALRNYHPATPLQKVQKMFADMERLRDTRKALRKENRMRFEGEALSSVVSREEKEAREAERERLRAASRRRLTQELAERERRIARRRAKKETDSSGE